MVTEGADIFLVSKHFIKKKKKQKSNRAFGALYNLLFSSAKQCHRQSYIKTVTSAHLKLVDKHPLVVFFTFSTKLCLHCLVQTQLKQKLKQS